MPLGPEQVLRPSTPDTTVPDVSDTTPVTRNAPLGAEQAVGIPKVSSDTSKIKEPNNYRPSFGSSLLYGVRDVLGINSPEDEEAWHSLPKEPYNRIGEAIGKGGTFGAALGIPGVVGGAVSEAVSSGLGETQGIPEGKPGHPVLNSLAGIIASVGAAPAISGLARFTMKAGRSIPEQFGLGQSRVNDLFSDIGNPKRAAGMNGSTAYWQQAQNALREGQGGSDIIRRSEQEVFDAVERRASQLADSLGPNLTQQELGEFAQHTMGQRILQIKADTDNMYNALAAVVPRQTELMPVNFANSLARIYDKYAGAPSLRQQFQQGNVGNYLNAVAEDLIRSPNGTIPYTVLQNVRTDIGEMISKGAINPNVNIKELREMYRGLTRDMESAYTSTNNLHGLRAFQTVNTAAETNFDNIERMGKLISANVEPELITQRLLSQANKGGTRLDDVTSQLNNIDPGARDMVMGHVLRRLGEMPDGSFNPNRFYTTWQKLSPEAKDLYPKAQREGIERLAQITGLVSDSFASQNMSHTAGNAEFLKNIGRAINGLTKIGGAGIMASEPSMNGLATGMGTMGIGEVLSATIGSATAQGLMARLWTSKAFNTWLGTYAPNVPLSKAVTSLSAVIAQEPALEPAIRYIGNYISGGDSGSPLRPGEKGRGFAEGGLYDTQLNSQEQSIFDIWKQKNAPNDSGADYDLRGAFKAGLSPADNGHWSDEFKKPNHPTFSNESKYSRENPELPAGSWMGDNFIPPGGYAEGGSVNLYKGLPNTVLNSILHNPTYGEDGNQSLKQWPRSVADLWLQELDAVSDPLEREQGIRTMMDNRANNDSPVWPHNGAPSFMDAVFGNPDKWNSYASGGPVNDNDLFGAPSGFPVKPRFGGYSGATRNPVSPSSVGVQDNKSVLDQWLSDIVPTSAGNQSSGYAISPTTKRGAQWDTKSPMNEWFPPIDVNDAANEFAEGGSVDRFSQAVNYISQNTGISPEVAKGAVKYMYKNESGLDPTALNPTSKALGIGQWLGSRKTALLSTYGNKPTFENQLEHLVKELKGPEGKTLKALLSSNAEKQGYDIWGSHFERPGSAALAKAGVNHKPGDVTISGASNGKPAISLVDQFLGTHQMEDTQEEPDVFEPIRTALSDSTEDPATKGAIHSILGHKA